MAINPFDQAHIARQVMSVITTFSSTLSYIQIFLQAMLAEIKSAAKGVIPGIERNTILEALIPVPPFEEQRRIVERVDQIMKLIGA